MYAIPRIDANWEGWLYGVDFEKKEAGTVSGKKSVSRFQRKRESNQLKRGGGGVA